MGPCWNATPASTTKPTAIRSDLTVSVTLRPHSAMRPNQIAQAETTAWAGTGARRGRRRGRGCGRGHGRAAQARTRGAGRRRRRGRGCRRGRWAQAQAWARTRARARARARAQAWARARTRARAWAQAQARARGQETMIYKPKKSRVRLFFSQLNLSFNPAATALFSGNAANNHTSTRHSAMP